MAKSKAVEEVIEEVITEANADLKAPKSAAKLEEEGDIAADYLEGLLDIADLDGDIDMMWKMVALLWQSSAANSTTSSAIKARF